MVLIDCLHCLVNINLVEQSSPSSNRHLDIDSLSPENVHTKRSHSCTPLLSVDGARQDRRRSSSVHTLIQLRRDSAKISEELANLTAQLSATMNTNCSLSKRASLSVPGACSTNDVDTPTIDQLLAKTKTHRSIHTSNSHLKVDSNRQHNHNCQSAKQARQRS
jgi:hypothetical protein